MPFEFIQIPANGQGSAKEGLNRSPSRSQQRAGAAVTNSKTQHPVPIDRQLTSRTLRVLIPSLLNPF